MAILLKKNLCLKLTQSAVPHPQPQRATQMPMEPGTVNYLDLKNHSTLAA